MRLHSSEPLMSIKEKFRNTHKLPAVSLMMNFPLYRLKYEIKNQLITLGKTLLSIQTSAHLKKRPESQKYRLTSPVISRLRTQLSSRGEVRKQPLKRGSSLAWGRESVKIALWKSDCDEREETVFRRLNCVPSKRRNAHVMPPNKPDRRQLALLKLKISNLKQTFE